MESEPLEKKEWLPFDPVEIPIPAPEPEKDLEVPPPNQGTTE